MLQNEYLGYNSIAHLQKILEKHHAQKIFLVTGKKSFIKSGAEKMLAPYLVGKNVVRFSDFGINPKIEDVSVGIKLIKETKPDLVIAIGGGSVIDMAKLINILSAQPSNSITDIVKDKTLIKNKSLLLIAIPTTAGTGSEATHFAVIYIKNVKYSLAHNYMIPDYAIVEPKLSFQLPSKLAAASAMDALSQAVESYWAVNSTNESKEYASNAIQMILPILQQAVHCEYNQYAKERMAFAANLAGKAINISKTTAAHAISYPITTYFDVAHGHAVALTLGKFFIINSNLKNAELTDRRGKDYVVKTMQELYKMFGCSNGRECCEKWYSLMDQIGLEKDVNDVGIKETSSIDLIIRNVSLERLKNNPVKIDNKTLTELFNKSIK